MLWWRPPDDLSWRLLHGRSRALRLKRPGCVLGGAGWPRPHAMRVGPSNGRLPPMATVQPRICRVPEFPVLSPRPVLRTFPVASDLRVGPPCLIRATRRAPRPRGPARRRRGSARRASGRARPTSRRGPAAAGRIGAGRRTTYCGWNRAACPGTGQLTGGSGPPWSWYGSDQRAVMPSRVPAVGCGS
jgi:hypothetical protein